jgi:hypothetical protein
VNDEVWKQLWQIPPQREPEYMEGNTGLPFAAQELIVPTGVEAILRAMPQVEGARRVERGGAKLSNRLGEENCGGLRADEIARGYGDGVGFLAIQLWALCEGSVAVGNVRRGNR